MAPDERVRVSVEAWSPAFTGSAKDDLTIGTGPWISLPSIYIILCGLLAVLLLCFLFSFTGLQSESKNRGAIMLSHLVIWISLIVPLVAPIILAQSAPEFVDQMRHAPVGLIVADTEDRNPSVPQWALNIGGFTSVKNPNTAESNAAAASPAPVSSPSVKAVDSPAPPAPTEPPRRRILPAASSGRRVRK